LSDIYNYQLDPVSKTISFITQYDIKITVAIARDKSWFPYNPEIKEVFSFDLFATPSSTKLDFKIRDTVSHILKDRFENTETVITYYCDDEDGKQRKRKDAFERWYQYVNNSSIHKYNRDVVFEKKVIHSSMLIHKNNTRYKKIVCVYEAGDADVTNKFKIE
jgi:hypothetical protein